MFVFFGMISLSFPSFMPIYTTTFTFPASPPDLFLLLLSNPAIACLGSGEHPIAYSVAILSFADRHGAREKGIRSLWRGILFTGACILEASRSLWRANLEPRRGHCENDASAVSGRESTAGERNSETDGEAAGSPSVGPRDHEVVEGRVDFVGVGRHRSTPTPLEVGAADSAETSEPRHQGADGGLSPASGGTGGSVQADDGEREIHLLDASAASLRRRTWGASLWRRTPARGGECVSARVDENNI